MFLEVGGPEIRICFGKAKRVVFRWRSSVSAVRKKKKEQIVLLLEGALVVAQMQRTVLFARSWSWAAASEVRKIENITACICNIETAPSECYCIIKKCQRSPPLLKFSHEYCLKWDSNPRIQ